MILIRGGGELGNMYTLPNKILNFFPIPPFCITTQTLNLLLCTNNNTGEE